MKPEKHDRKMDDQSTEEDNEVVEKIANYLSGQAECRKKARQILTFFKEAGWKSPE